MKKDFILGWALIILVGISLFLSYALWSNIPGNMTAINRTSDVKRLDLVSVVRPVKIVVHLGNSSHTVIKQSSYFYDDIIKYCDNTLAKGWSEGSPEPVDIRSDFFVHKKGFKIFLPTPLPASFVKQVLEVESSGSASSDDKLIDSYIIIKDEFVKIYLRDVEGKYYKLGKDIESPELDTIIDTVKESDPPAYANLPSGNLSIRISSNTYISLSPYYLPVYEITQNTSPSEDIISKYFPDFSVTRKIREKDGVIIYTDGQRGFRIYPDNSLEYNYPGTKDEDTDFYDALNIAVDFVNRRGGWPEDAYLSSFEIEKNNGRVYKFNFRTRLSGYQVVMDKEYFTVVVQGSQVRHFYKHPINVKAQQDVTDLISPITALDIAVAKKEVKAVDDIYPAYYIKQGQIRPIWVIKTGKKQIIIENHSE